MNNIKVYLVCIAKQENLYIKEFVNHYKLLGINKIILYDNNDFDGERFEDVINDQINSKFVEVINVRGITGKYHNKFLQDYVYLEAYNRYGNECDWICFFDIDEFLMLDEKYHSIQDFLSDEIFNEYDSIKIVWKLFDDNNNIQYEDKPLIERFTNISFKNDNEVKSIIRTNLCIRAINCHGKTIPLLKCCNTNGKPIVYLNERHGNIINLPSYKNACLNHYRLKTLDEFLNVRCKRGDMGGDAAKQKLTLDYFFTFNKKTPEKLAYLKSIGIDYE